MLLICRLIKINIHKKGEHYTLKKENTIHKKRRKLYTKKEENYIQKKKKTIYKKEECHYQSLKRVNHQSIN